MGKRILAVDDDQDILDIYSMVLGAEGYEVKTLISPDNLAGAIVEFVPDLILLDIQLGTYNGLELCKTLKSSPITNHIPIITVSGHESISLAKSEFCANDILDKPFDLADLTEKVGNFLLAKVISFKQALA